MLLSNGLYRCCTLTLHLLHMCDALHLLHMCDALHLLHLCYALHLLHMCDALHLFHMWDALHLLHMCDALHSGSRVHVYSKPMRMRWKGSRPRLRATALSEPAAAGGGGLGSEAGALCGFWGGQNSGKHPMDNHCHKTVITVFIMYSIVKVVLMSGHVRQYLIEQHAGQASN